MYLLATSHLITKAIITNCSEISIILMYIPHKSIARISRINLLAIISITNSMMHKPYILDIWDLLLFQVYNIKPSFKKYNHVIHQESEFKKNY